MLVRAAKDRGCTSHIHVIYKVQIRMVLISYESSLGGYIEQQSFRLLSELTLAYISKS